MGKKENSAAYWKAQKEMPKAKHRPQDKYPEFLEYRRQLNNALLTSRTNPHVNEIMAFQPPSWLFDPLEITSKAYPVIVESREAFMKMMQDLKQQRVIAVDFEEHHLHSYLGMQMYIQVSTENFNYLIHIPSCFSFVLDHMRVIFESFSVVKILHGGDSDVLHLQRDFGIFAVAVVDTQYVYNYVYGITEKGFRIGFKTMSKELLKSANPVDFEASLQLADWRIHPLPENMKLYAMYDSFLLLKCWDLLRVNLIDGAWEQSSLNPFLKSNAMAAKGFKGKVYPSATQDASRMAVTTENMSVFTSLHYWREQRARFVDEPPSEVINTKELAEIVKKKPSSLEELKSVFAPYNYPFWIKEVKDEMLQLINAAQVPVPMETDDDWEEELLIHAPEEDFLLPPTPAPQAFVQVPAENKKEKPKIKSVVRDVSQLSKLPEVRKKWTSVPPHPVKRVNPNRPLKRKSRPPRRRIALSPESRKYQRRRRTFNYRRNKQERKYKICLQLPVTSEGPSLEEPFKEGVCDAHEFP